MDGFACHIKWRKVAIKKLTEHSKWRSWQKGSQGSWPTSICRLGAWVLKLKIEKNTFCALCTICSCI